MAHIEVDQSGKIEQTSLDTVVAFRNTEQFTVLMKKKIKAEILVEYRKKHKDIVYRLFAILIFICIKNYLGKLKLVMIDNEYKGREIDIKKHLLNLILKNNPDFDKRCIKFGNISKKSRAHITAYQTFAGKLAPNKVVLKEEVEKFL